VGSHAILRGLSLGVIGMTQGELKRLQLQPQDAYGTVEKRLIREIPRAQFPPHLTLRVGKRLTARLRKTGRRRMVRIVQVKSESVRVDGNHPLAGRVVTLEVHLISVDSSANANRSNPQFDVGGES
jgi:peptidylprolyl isomerase